MILTTQSLQLLSHSNYSVTLTTHKFAPPIRTMILTNQSFVPPVRTMILTTQSFAPSVRTMMLTTQSLYFEYNQSDEGRNLYTVLIF